MKFHNPYHFVPVRPGARSGDVDAGAWRAGEVPRLRHDRYVAGTLSGRILCRLEAATPFFVGAERTEGTPATVDPFLLGGEPAIPASSLRGLVSAVAEAASNSALRVLTGDPEGLLSFRREMGEALSAIGMIVAEEAVDGGRTLRLRPLCLPNLPVGGDGYATLPRRYWEMFGGERRFAPLKVYVGDRSSIQDSTFPYRTFRLDRPKVYGLRLRRPAWERAPGVGWRLPAEPDLHRAARGRGPVIAQRQAGSGEPVPWEDVPAAESAEYVPGILRVLGIWGRPDVPATKKHELFLPLDEPFGEESSPPATFPILDSALDRFHELAEQRTEARKSESEGGADESPLPRLPYEPRDTRRNDDPAGGDDRVRLKAGDLVYFEPTDDGRAIEEIALSSIWRGRVETRGAEARAATIRTFFETLDPELVPFHTGREILTPAEQLFGFVAQDEVEASGKGGAGRAQAGRVRFSFGLLGRAESERRDPYLHPEPRTLRVLASPKPPSPALYFRRKNGRGYIAKPRLDPAQHQPQGRKFYLHHRQRGGRPPWEAPPDSDRERMQSRIKPLRKGLAFYFHVEFDNLSAEEMGLLCYALRPTEDFLHKLGMGKPIGLGSVRIDPLAILYIDRAKRYSGAGWFAPRYAGVWRGEGVDRIEHGPDAWRDEIAALQQWATPDAAAEHGFGELRQACRTRLDPDVRRALERLGETVSDRVSPPLVENQDPEASETYKWFVANDRGSSDRASGVKHPAKQQALEPLDVWLKTHDRGLPTLEPNPWAGDE